MIVSRLVLVETSQPGNLGAAMRVAANFGIPSLSLVRPAPGLLGEEARRWACGAEQHLEVSVHERLEDAVAETRTLIGSASGRGRENLPVVEPASLAAELRHRSGTTALVFGNETRGLSRSAIDRCDLVVRVPTVEQFPVLNLAQAVAITVASLAASADEEAPSTTTPAPHAGIESLMEHAQRALLRIGFLDPVNPARILRKLRRMVGRAGLTENDVAILHGICRQMIWAADGEVDRAERRHGTEDPDVDR